MRVIIIKVVVVVFVVFEINASISHKEGTIANYQMNTISKAFTSVTVYVSKLPSPRDNNQREGLCF